MRRLLCLLGFHSYAPWETWTGYVIECTYCRKTRRKVFWDA